MLNPVLRREMRAVFRTWRTFIIMTLYVFILAGASGLYLFVLDSNSYYDGFNPQEAGYLFILLSGFQMGLIMLIVPALTGGGISTERERQTLDLMLITKMSTFSIVIGKLLSSVLVVTLLIVSSMPVFSVLLYYGGFSFLHVLEMVLFTLVTAVFAGSVSIFFSAVLKRTVAAIVLSYIVVLIFSFGPMILGFILYIVTDTIFYDVLVFPAQIYFWILSGSPVMGFISLLDSQMGTSNTIDFVNVFGDYNATFWDGYFFPLWVVYVVISLLLSVFFLNLAAYLIQPVKTKGN